MRSVRRQIFPSVPALPPNFVPRPEDFQAAQRALVSTPNSPYRGLCIQVASPACTVLCLVTSLLTLTRVWLAWGNLRLRALWLAMRIFCAFTPVGRHRLANPRARAHCARPPVAGGVHWLTLGQTPNVTQLQMRLMKELGVHYPTFTGVLCVH